MSRNTNKAIKTKIKKTIKSLFFTLFILLCLSRVAYASTEVSDAHAHYKHPVLDIIEDTGNNLGIGQGMCENVLYDRAFFEQRDGRIYLTVRFSLASSIKDVSFAVQEKGDKDFIALVCEKINEKQDSADYRMLVPSKDIVLRADAFVEDMGRSVIFYADFDGFVDGNTDFLSLDDVSTSLELSDSAQKIEIRDVSELSNLAGIGYEHGLLTRDSAEIKKMRSLAISLEENTIENAENVNDKLDENANENANKNAEHISEIKYDDKYISYADVELGHITRACINGLVIFFVLVVVFFLIAAFVLYVLTKRLKEINEANEEVLYEEE